MFTTHIYCLLGLGADHLADAAVVTSRRFLLIADRTIPQLLISKLALIILNVALGDSSRVYEFRGKNVLTRKHTSKVAPYAKHIADDKVSKVKAVEACEEGCTGFYESRFDFILTRDIRHIVGENRYTLH